MTTQTEINDLINNLDTHIGDALMVLGEIKEIDTDRFEMKMTDFLNEILTNAKDLHEELESLTEDL